MTNSKYHPYCNTDAKNCVSGCCDMFGGCATLWNICTYQYQDYRNNQNYYFSAAVNINCNYFIAHDCRSGCCTHQGSCANISSQCQYKYFDFPQNPYYYYPGITINSNYNTECNTDARNCASGCCAQNRTCALTYNTCYYQYSNYYSNINYYYPNDSSYCNSNCKIGSRNCVSGCCTSAGYCSITNSTCYYKYTDFNTNHNYYFSGDKVYSNCDIGTQCYDQMNAAQLKLFMQAIGVYVGYLIIFAVFIIYCFCKRKRLVLLINKMDTQGTYDFGDDNHQDLNKSSMILNNSTLNSLKVNNQYSSSTVHPVNTSNDISQQSLMLNSLSILPPLKKVKSSIKLQV